MRVGSFLRSHPGQAALVLGIAALIAMTLHPAAFVQAGPEEVVLLDIVDLRRFYRSLLGEEIDLEGAEFFGEDASPDLEASVRYLEDLGIVPLEVYGSYVLAQVDEAAKSWLESQGIRAEPIPQRTLIPLGTYPFDTREGEPVIPPSLAADPPVGGTTADFIVQFLGPQKPSWREQIVADGGEIKAFLGRFAAVVEMTGAEASAVGSLPFVEWTGLYHPAYKIPPALLERSGELEIVVSMFSGSDSTDVSSFIQARGGVVIGSWPGGLHVRLDASGLGPLAHIPAVSAIEIPMVARALNDETTAILQSGGLGSRPVFARGIQGQGQLLTLADTGINEQDLHEAFDDPNNPIGDLHRKIQANEPFHLGVKGDESGHGTHVAGTLAGDAPVYDVYDVYDGHAFRARLYVQDIGDQAGVHAPIILGDLFQAAVDKGSWIHSDSWATYPQTGPPANYSFRARQADLFVFQDDQDFVIVFSAGNEGPNTGTISGVPHAKNVIVVGALNGTTDIRDTSSRGLTKDGRISPTVVAPGRCITSARRDTSVPPTNDPACAPPTPMYEERSGTSMATPAVSGSVALIRQYLLEGWYPTGSKVSGHEVTPTAALLKALLVNSAVQLTGAGAFEHFNYFPNGDQGWGRPLLEDVLYFGLQGETRRTGWRDVTPGLSAGETMIFKLKVTSTSGPMNVALVWTDPPPAASDCTDCLVNDLDLTLKSPGGYWYHGNRYECGYAFPPGPPYESCEHQYIWQLTPDRKNNVETFYAITPPTGTWEARITAPFVTSGPQAFSLVLTGHGLNHGINGIVRDAATSAPIANAQVTLTGVQHSRTATTGPDGRFSTNAPPDSYTMTTDGVCQYLPDTRSVTSDPGFLREEEVLLMKRGLGTVFGTVKDDSGTPLSLAKVREACTGTYVFTDAGGSYSLQTVPGDIDVQVTASKFGYVSSTKTVSVAPGGSKEEHFVLTEIGCTIFCPT